MAPQLKVVKELSREDVIHHLNNGYKSLSDLERRSGIDRKILEGLQEEIDPKRQKRLRMPPRKGLNPIVQEETTSSTTENNDLKQDSSQEEITLPQASFVLKLVAAGAVLLGIYVLCIGVWLNCQYNSSLGHDWISSFIMGSQGAGIDLAPSFFMPFAGDLWIRRRKFMAFLAILLWIACTLYSAISYESFAATNRGDASEARKAQKSRFETLSGQLETAQSELTSAKKDRDQQDKNIKILDQNVQTARSYVPPERIRSSDDCNPKYTTSSYFVCDQLVQYRKRLETAQADSKSTSAKIDKLEDKISGLEADLKTLPAIADASPGTAIGRATGGYVKPEQVETVQVNGSVLTLIMPGFLFMFARVLLR